MLGVSLDYLYRRQVQVSVYCSWRIPAHLRCTQCSPYGYRLPTMYLLMADIANPDLFVGSGFVSTSPTFMRRASHPAVCKRSDSSTACRLCCLELSAWPDLTHCSQGKYDIPTSHLTQTRMG